MFIDKILADSSAVIHAFLPGTSGGQGIVDAIVGSYVMRQILKLFRSGFISKSFYNIYLPENNYNKN